MSTRSFTLQIGLAIPLVVLGSSTDPFVHGTMPCTSLHNAYWSCPQPFCVARIAARGLGPGCSVDTAALAYMADIRLLQAAVWCHAESSLSQAQCLRHHEHEHCVIGIETAASKTEAN